jgi:hypothetical protein
MIVPLSHYRKWLISFQDERTREFIRKARLVYGDRYDFRFVKYLSYNIKVCILCLEHGEFWKTPDNFLHNQKCPLCKKQEPKKRIYYTNESFIESAKLIHGDKYDYSKVQYEKSSKEVCISCSKHGDFWQKPEIHLAGHGCPQCGIDAIR